MFCKSCGATIAEDSVYCPACGQAVCGGSGDQGGAGGQGMPGPPPAQPPWGAPSPPPGWGAPPPPYGAPPQYGAPPPYGGPPPYGQPMSGPVGPVPNYLVQSILATLFCCLPLGVAGIVFSAQSSSKQSRGDYTGAWDSANRAKLMCWISLGAGLVLFVGFFLVGLLGSSGSNP